MLAKFIIIAFPAEVLLSENKALGCVHTTCPQWVKLNKSPVCFGAKGNSFGKFTCESDVSVSSFMFVHQNGTVSCRRKAQSTSYWGCIADSNDLAAILTDQQDKILAPAASKVSKNGWYRLEGYTSSSSALVFCVSEEPHHIIANSELRLWYGEDLKGFTESDNSGRTCADVYGLLA